MVSVTIPQSVTSIGNCAFEFCINLPHIVIPESIVSIGDSTFYCCKRLSSMFSVK
nr:leucine-rich repeat protein [Clostridium sp. J1101437_171009_A5]